MKHVEVDQCTKIRRGDVDVQRLDNALTATNLAKLNAINTTPRPEPAKWNDALNPLRADQVINRASVKGNKGIVTLGAAEQIAPLRDSKPLLLTPNLGIAENSSDKGQRIDRHHPDHPEFNTTSYFDVSIDRFKCPRYGCGYYNLALFTFAMMTLTLTNVC
jgi:hypothetical protein